MTNMATKQNEYFDCFSRLVEYSCQAADYLHDCMIHFSPATIGQQITSMHEIEHDADREKHHMMEKLAREFITPIEREDIIQLAQEIDEVTDRIEDVLMRVYMYNFRSIRTEVLAFTEVITRCCCALRKAVEEFPSFRKSKTIHQYLVDVNTLEEEGDHLYVSSVRGLYKEGGDSVLVPAWANTFDCLEKCCDACEHVANVIESVIMKNT